MLSPADVAERTGLSRSVIYRAIENGDLPAYKLCDRLRVDVDDFEAWKSAHRVEPKPQQQGPMIEAPAPVREVQGGGSFRGQLRALRGGENAA